MSAPSAGPSVSSPSQAPGARGTFLSALASEFALLRHPKVILACLAIVFVPSLYVLIYVSSVWDPYGNVSQLPAGLVNEDVPVTVGNRSVQVGAEVIKTLQTQKPFAFRTYPDAAAAHLAVETGEVFFALVIPANFSRQIFTGHEPAEFVVHLSEGANYTAGVFSKRFGVELAHTINETLAKEHWAALIGDDPANPSITLRQGLSALQNGSRELADGTQPLQAGSAQLRDGLDSASSGATRLAEGLTQFTAASSQLSSGLTQVSAAVATMRSRLPTDAQLGELAEGSTALTSGAHALADGMKQLESGEAQLEDGARRLQEGVAKVPFVGGKMSDGAGQLRAGMTTFSAGLTRAGEGSEQLDAGLVRLDGGLQPLAKGLVELNAGLATLGEKLPTPDQLALFDTSAEQLRNGSSTLAAGTVRLANGGKQVADGAARVAAGAEKLSAGVNTLVQTFDAGLGGATANKLAAPVTARFNLSSPVASNGPAFAPYFSALSLWIGAVMMSFVFYLRRLPDSLQTASRLTQWSAKACPLLLLGTLQATVVAGVGPALLGLTYAHPAEVWLAALIGSWAFVSLVLALMALLGDAGRLLAVIGLILQLAASGGIYPIELSPSFYQRVHGWLPLTALVRSFRATMFGAFQSHWSQAAFTLVAFALGASLLGIGLARWRYVPRATYGPAVEF